MKPRLNVLWFRHGLRLHDNPALHEAVDRMDKDVGLLPLFIFDGETAGTKMCGNNRFKFLLECLADLDEQFRAVGSRLFVCRGKPIDVFDALHLSQGIANLCFEQDCEPVWKTRDETVKDWCQKQEIPWFEKVGHTLWNPHEVVAVNGGTPPMTFSMFNHVISSIGQPGRPLPDVDLSKVKMAVLDEKLCQEIDAFPGIPSPENFDVLAEGVTSKVYMGGEKTALEHLEVRLAAEAKAFQNGSFLPNQRDPDILCPPKSLSPDLRFGSLSVRKFYWGLRDAYEGSLEGSKRTFNPHIMEQLIWREFFYTMSITNEFYDEMERNPICIQIPWYKHENNDNFKAFEEARTGYPFIDAGMRQLYKEGWVHHIVRNALACFLTRGDLWLSWEAGLKIFLKNLLDADWSVCAGNWMWVSSSAFEQVLSCGTCIDPAVYGRRSDPWGEYVIRYLPELAKYPVEFLYEPWRAPLDVQKKAGCVVGKDYPERIVLHEKVSRENRQKMEELKDNLMRLMNQVPVHCAPSNEEETRVFMSFPDSCQHHDDFFPDEEEHATSGGSGASAGVREQDVHS